MCGPRCPTALSKLLFMFPTVYTTQSPLPQHPDVEAHATALAGTGTLPVAAISSSSCTHFGRFGFLVCFFSATVLITFLATCDPLVFPHPHFKLPTQLQPPPSPQSQPQPSHHQHHAFRIFRFKHLTLKTASERSTFLTLKLPLQQFFDATTTSKLWLDLHLPRGLTVLMNSAEIPDGQPL